MWTPSIFGRLRGLALHKHGAFRSKSVVLCFKVKMQQPAARTYTTVASAIVYFTFWCYKNAIRVQRYSVYFFEKHLTLYKIEIKRRFFVYIFSPYLTNSLAHCFDIYVCVLISICIISKRIFNCLVSFLFFHSALYRERESEKFPHFEWGKKLKRQNT